MSGEVGTDSFAITPSDSATYQLCRALWVGVTGDVTLKHRRTGATALFKNVPVGWLDVQNVAVMATGTTASALRGVL
jgi:hypothetical protein